MPEREARADGSAWPFRLLKRMVMNARKMLGRKRESGKAEDLSRMGVSLQAILDEIPVFVYQVDTSHRHVYANKPYADFVGRPRGSLPGLSLEDIYPPETARAFMGNNQAILERGEAETFEEVVSLPDGPHTYLSIKKPLYDEAGGPIGVLGISTDISDRKSAEKALREADRHKEEFLALLGHELRNPLAPLANSLALMEGSQDPLIQRLHPLMNRQVAHLSRLVDDLLDVSRLSHGKIRLQRRLMDLNAALEAALEQAGPFIRQHGQRIELEQEKASLLVRGDMERLTQVVVNLLTNAAKYMKQGGTITVLTEREEDQAVLRVRDTGYGIPPENLRDLFEVFTQVPEHQQLVGGGGLGMGLAICKQLVELHGGSISVASEGLGQGTEFRITLPLKEGRPETKAEEENCHLAPSRVLVVDDNIDSAASLGEVLRLQGHTVATAHDAEEALAVLKNFRPQVALLDIGLPETDGYTLARRLRQTPDYEQLALIALTGWGNEDDKRRAREAGFDDHLTKPVSLHHLARAIGGAMESRQEV